ncbi:hypothetical protein FACS189460_4090 [Deltaproteobacteria bacterium]|nr:hypothetical protein FACS189460_4090 [Deltaproteobacteria bacterium]
MKETLLQDLVCPETKSTLALTDATVEEGEISAGTMINSAGKKYIIADGIPDLLDENEATGISRFARDYYTKFSDNYDDIQGVTFDLYHDQEAKVRELAINQLELKPDYTVLEVSAGTGQDSEKILNRLPEGRLIAFDLTPAMLKKNREKCAHGNIDFVAGSATSLPFRDNTFNALYCFAGVGHFPNIPKALKEMARVVKVGGKVVFLEKNVPPWLINSEYGKILINNNPMFAEDIPLRHLPVEAREVRVRWILGQVHYLIDYTVGEGEPKGNFDLLLPGERGGSFNTRYYGRLEGVSPEVKNLALAARKKLGLSMHDWLNDLIRREAEKVLNRQ